MIQLNTEAAGDSNSNASIVFRVPDEDSDSNSAAVFRVPVWCFIFVDWVIHLNLVFCLNIDFFFNFNFFCIIFLVYRRMEGA